MPIIQFTKADILRSQNLENEHWYSFEIAKAEQKTNKNKDGFNLVTTFRLVDTGTELDGKEITRTDCLISKGRSFAGSILPIVAAAKGVNKHEIPVEDFNVDTDDLQGKRVDAKHVLDLYEGQLVAKLDDFAPYKSAANGSTPF